MVLIGAGIFLEKLKLDKTIIDSVPYATVNIDENEVSQRYYYSTLSEEEKIVYKEVLQGIQGMKKEIYVHEQEAEKVNQIYETVLCDFPELFWCDGTAETTGYGQADMAYCLFKPKYVYEGEELKAKKQEIETSVNACISGMDGAASEYDKIKYVYEYIINTTEYSLEAPDNQNIYSVFVNKQSVCAGYAKSLQYILNRMGIFSTYITGTVEGQQLHAWNLVKCGGDYYYVDSTWGDPIFMQTEQDMPVGAKINYDYLCCTSAELFKTHTPDGDIPLLECTALQYNYYVQTGSYYEQYNKEDIKNAMFQSIEQQKEYIDFKFANEELYVVAREELLGDILDESTQYLGRQYGLKQVQYYYQEDKPAGRITIYWNYGEKIQGE